MASDRGKNTGLGNGKHSGTVLSLSIFELVKETSDYLSRLTTTIATSFYQQESSFQSFCAESVQRARGGDPWLNQVSIVEVVLKIAADADQWGVLSNCQDNHCSLSHISGFLVILSA